MKKLYILSLVAAATFFSCASFGESARPINNAPTALVSFVANYDIPWEGESATNPALVSRSVKREIEENPDKAVVTNSSILINVLEKIFFDCLTDSGDIKLLKKEILISSEAYAAAELDNRRVEGDGDEFSTPASYRYVDSGDDAFFAALKAETGAQSGMFVTLDLTKAMVSGIGKNGSLSADISMNVIIKNAEGGTIQRKTFSVRSRDRIDVSSGCYSESGLLGLFKSAMTDLCYYYMDYLAD